MDVYLTDPVRAAMPLNFTRDRQSDRDDTGTVQSLITHSVLGLGLYVSALGINLIGGALTAS